MQNLEVRSSNSILLSFSFLFTSIQIEGFGDDQGNRYDHEVAVAHKEFYLDSALASLPLGKVPHSRRPSGGKG